MELTDVYMVFHPATTSQYTFLSAVHGTFFTIDRILGRKASLNKYKKIEITFCIMSAYNAIKVKLNNKSSNRKYSKNWNLNNTLFNN
jgi:TRAP-type mannitol/chloroaromatic compound transport system permease small subunit